MWIDFCYNNIMKEKFPVIGDGLTEEQAEKFFRFEEMLLQDNKLYNLTAIIEPQEVEIKHFADSISGEKFLAKNSSVAEVGSGAGFPSVPLMIIRDDLIFTLFESNGKKCGFLEKVIKQLNLSANVVCERAEVAAKNLKYREKFDYCIARAVAPMSVLCEYCLPFVKKGGEFIAYKGEDNELSSAENAIRILGGKVKENYCFSLPCEKGQRNINCVFKACNTPLMYPRGNGKERKKPL